MVRQLCCLGYDAFGCDLQFKAGRHVDELVSQGRLRLIRSDPYTLPFDDCFLDVAVSDQVFEHVMDYDIALGEIDRVLKEGGASLHVFPARYMPVEPHVRVPGATVIRNEWWLLLWARLGVRTDDQGDDGAAAVAEKNRGYLLEHTNYLGRREIESAFARHFDVVRFAEREYLRRDDPGESRPLRRWLGGIPFMPSVYSSFRSRVVYAAKVNAGS